MKQKTFLVVILLLFCMGAQNSGWAQTGISNPLTLAKAFPLIKEQFANRDVDFYAYDNSQTVGSKNYVEIFVDCSPMEGWEHECYLMRVTLDESYSPRIARQALRMPPEGRYTKLEVKSQYPAYARVKPKVAASSQTNEIKEAASRTYALIISGGINPTSNYERYWNDCSFIYQTLTNKYGVPKSHIFPIMADGDDPAIDTNLYSGGYASQSLDLDGDGMDEIELAATKDNITSVLNSLKTTMRKDDHLFIYVIDHGGTTDNNSQSYICLWGGGRLYDTELAALLKPFTTKAVNVNVVLGQCYSGGFIDDLEMAGCVVATASKGSEPSWGCADIPYDEFVYQWTCAVNGANHTGQKTDADSYKDGVICMQEAFLYAQKNDRRKAETPQYASTPTSIGEDLAFDRIAPAVDLYIQDSADDTGREPNLVTQEFWKSPSIWIRNQDDGIYVHQNPIYNADHQMAYVYVRVHNRGKQKYTGGKWLHVYWSQASTNITAKVWRGRETYNNTNVTGGPLEAISIDPIEPGGYRDVKVKWALPSLLERYPKGNFHFCLLAKLMDTSYDDTYVEGETKYNLKESNDVAQKNVTIISENELLNDFKVYVRNDLDIQKPYTLELVPRSVEAQSFFNKGVVELVLSAPIFTAWTNGGCQGTDFFKSPSTSSVALSNTVRLTSTKSKLDNILLKANQFDIVGVKIKYNSSANMTSEGELTFDLIQKDADGNILGGETFIVEPSLSQASSNNVEISSSVNEDGSILLSSTSGESQQVEWRNDNFDTLSEEATLCISPHQAHTQYTLWSVTDGENLSSNVVNTSDIIGIKEVTFSKASKTLNLEFHNSVPVGASVMIASAYSPSESYKFTLEEGNIYHTIDVSSLKEGIYAITYLIGDNIVDTSKIMIE